MYSSNNSQPLSSKEGQSQPESQGFNFLRSLDLISNPDPSEIGGKAAHLVLLKKAGLPVPDGFCVATDAYDYYTEHGELPTGLVQEVVTVMDTLGGHVIIRSSANCEDGESISMAGVFQSFQVDKGEQVASSILQIYEQARSDEVAQFLALHGKFVDQVKMGLIIQQVVEPEAAGVIYTNVNQNQLLVQYTDSHGRDIVDGKTSGSALLMGPKGTVIKSTGFDARLIPQAVIQQIAAHTSSIQELFSGTPQDIEFVSRDKKTHIVQARTLTANINIEIEETPEDCLEFTKHGLRQMIVTEKRELGTNTAIFSSANYSELLPRPTEMDIGIYMYVWGGSDGIPGATQLGRMEMGYQVGPEATGIIKYIGGRTYASIARYAGIYHIGFPHTKAEYYSVLVNEYLQAVQDDPEKGSYPQMGLFMQDPSLEDLRIRFGARAEEYFTVYQEFTARMRVLADKFMPWFYHKRLSSIESFISNAQDVNLRVLAPDQLLDYSIGILEHIRTYSYVDFVKAARLGFYYSQRLQDLLRLRFGMQPSETQEVFSRLNQGLDGSAITEANIAIAQVASEEAAKQLALRLVGHFSAGEMLEIRHLRLRDDPEALDTYVKGIRQSGNYLEQFQRQQKTKLKAQLQVVAALSGREREELDHVIQSSQRYMALRETTKYLFAREYLLLRDALEVMAGKLGLDHEDIYFLYPRELEQIVEEPQSMFHLIRARQQSFSNYRQIDMPSIIRESDVENLKLSTEDLSYFTEARGKFLAQGEVVQGIIINLDDFKSPSDISTTIERYRSQGHQIILVATQVNLSHDPFIFQSSGIIIENAGLVAHGAQRARELGKGAIGGIKSRLLKTGTRVVFDPNNRLVKRIE